MKIGNKIRKIRELKNISPKEMADRLNISSAGLHKIEREEVDVNIERLMEIASIFEMKAEELLTFDEKIVLNNIHGANVLNSIGPNTYVAFPEEIKKLYEENVKLHIEKNKLQEEVIAMQKSVIAKLEQENIGLKG